MGKHAKIMVGTTSRVWRKPAPETGLPPSDGSILSEVGVQDFWETSAGQQPIEGEAGILTVFLGGNAADRTKTDAEVRARRLPRRPPPDMAEDGGKS